MNARRECATCPLSEDIGSYMTKRLQYFVFLLAFGLFLFLLVTIGYYHFCHTILDGGFWSPAIAMEPQSVDFGDVSVADDVRREITIKNTGWRSLVIEGVRPSCSNCIVIQSYPKEPILPGNHGKIAFSLDISKRRDKVETSFVIVSNAEPQKAVVVTVTANVLAESQ